MAVTPQYGDQSQYPKLVTAWSSNTQYPQQPPVSGLNEFPIVKDKVTLKVAVPSYAYVMDWEDNDLTRYMEELTNVHVEWDVLPEVDTMTQINLRFSAASAGTAFLPDVFMGCGFPSTMLITLGSQKLIIPLQDLIARDGYNQNMMFKENPTLKPYITSADGNIYTLGGINATYTNFLAMRFWINQTFLDKLGMKTPTTTDEYYEYLKAVKTRDPNGNGKADEIPLVGATEGWHAEIDGFLMNAFIYNETSTDRNPVYRRRVYLTDKGKIEASFNKPEWLQGIQWLRKLCQEGLLDPSSFTNKKEELRALVENPDADIVGSLPNGGPHEFAYTQGERRTHWAALPPLKGPNGVRQIWYDEYAKPTMGSYVITKDCKIPDIAMKWADYAFTDDFATRNRYGVLGRDWKIPPANVIAVNGEPAKYEEILRWGTPQKAYWARSPGAWSRWGSFCRAKSDDPFELEYVLYNAYQEYLPYAFRQGVPNNLAFTLQESRDYNELNQLIIDYVEQQMAAWITQPNRDPAAEWNNYVATLDKMGLPRLLTITQTAFDRQWAAALGYK